MPAIAAAAARRKGIEVDEIRAQQELEDIRTFFASAVPRMMRGDPAVGGEAITAGYARSRFTLKDNRSTRRRPP